MVSINSDSHLIQTQIIFALKLTSNISHTLILIAKKTNEKWMSSKNFSLVYLNFFQWNSYAQLFNFIFVLVSFT